MILTREELQKMINQANDRPEYMRRIGESYLRGDVLKDKVAAESWLIKAIKTEDAKEAPIAMAIYVKEILEKEQILSDEDYIQIKEEYELATGEKKAELEILLNFATLKQKGI